MQNLEAHTVPLWRVLVAVYLYALLVVIPQETLHVVNLYYIIPISVDIMIMYTEDSGVLVNSFIKTISSVLLSFVA